MPKPSDTRLQTRPRRITAEQLAAAARARDYWASHDLARNPLAANEAGHGEEEADPRASVSARASARGEGTARLPEPLPQGLPSSGS